MVGALLLLRRAWGALAHVLVSLRVERSGGVVANRRDRARTDSCGPYRRAARRRDTVAGDRTRTRDVGDYNRALLHQRRLQHPAALDANVSASYVRRAAEMGRQL